MSAAQWQKFLKSKHHDGSQGTLGDAIYCKENQVRWVETEFRQFCQDHRDRAKPYYRSNGYMLNHPSYTGESIKILTAGKPEEMQIIFWDAQNKNNSLVLPICRVAKRVFCTAGKCWSSKTIQNVANECFHPTQCRKYKHACGVPCSKASMETKDIKCMAWAMLE